jgi:type IX secretion system PorP/SprF family membrane protein
MQILKSAVLALSVSATFTSTAQDAHFSPFEATPLSLNPALTGMFEGKVRASGIYYNQWGSVTVPYVGYGLSYDMPVLIRKQGYFGIGGYAINDKAGDGDLQNFTANLSVAYHKQLSLIRNSEIAIGLKGGYNQYTIDLTELYFGSMPTHIIVPNNNYALGMGNSVNYYSLCGGLTFSHAPSTKVNYIVGLSVNNTQEPNEAIQKKNTGEANLCYTGTLGANLLFTKRITFHPAILYQYINFANNIIAGNEFRYHTLNRLSVFMGAYYRIGDALNLTAGINTGKFRVGVAYDYNLSSLYPASNGKGGVMLNLKYIAPDFKSAGKKRFVPCNRF